MRNLKKILALVLAMVMAFSVMSVAGAFSDDEKFSGNYAEAAEVLEGLGVFQGYPDGSFRPEQTITRAEAAALIYRIASGDVGDANKELYKYNGPFTDVSADHWAAGYINYCANGEYIRGKSATIFDPEAKVTGYEVLAMILRVVGYDANKEFTGAKWETTVATTAESLGITGTVAGISLRDAAPRQIVAELLFRTLVYAPVVKYTAALGYQPVVTTPVVNVTAGTTTLAVGGQTLGQKVFKLTRGETMEIDKWGRPGYYWFSDGAPVATIEEEYLAQYNTFVTECQIAADTGIATHRVFKVFHNGVGNKTTYDVVATDTVYGVGAQGRLTEVYGDRIVMIDTYLAQVTSAVPARYDAAGHQIVAASNGLHVYNKAGNPAVTTDTTNGYTAYTIPGNKYTVGQFILISIVSGEKNNSQAVAGATIGATNWDLVPTSPYAPMYDDKDIADTLVGGQTVLFSNGKQHVVNGTTYNDANTFYLDEAVKETSNHTWYFDEYGNLIGATNIATAYSFGTIKNIQWINPIGESGYAQATIVLMDGSEQSMIVDKLINGTTEYDLTYYDITEYNYPYVSTNIDQNYASYAGHHLYRIETNANGSVNLNMVQSITTPKAIGKELAKADVRTNTPIITTGDKTGSIYVNDNTQFLVGSNVKSKGISFTAVTGYTKIGNFTKNDDVTVDYVDQNGDGFAEYVYIIGTPDSTTANGLFYLTDANVKTVLKGYNAVDYYELTGYVDGVLGSIKIPGGYESVLNAIMTAGVGKMSLVGYLNGKVIGCINDKATQYAGVTTWNNLDQTLGGAYTNMNLSTYFTTPNTLGSSSSVTSTNSTAVVQNGVLKVTVTGGNTAAYNLSNATYVGGTLNEGPVTDKAIYVVYYKYATDSSMYIASTVYVMDYVIQNPGQGTVPTLQWITQGNYAYAWVREDDGIGQITTTSYGETVKSFATTFSGSVQCVAPNGTTTWVTATETNNLASASVLQLADQGYTITLFNEYGVWSFV